MPYACKKNGMKWCLTKIGSDEPLGTHDTKRECTQQMRAIYANELSRTENIIVDGIIDKYSLYNFEEKIAAAGDEIHVVINSKGGDFLTAIDKHQKLRNSGKKVIVHVNPLAASSGAIIALAGDKIYMPENGLMVFHPPQHVPDGILDAEGAKAILNSLEASQAMLVNTLASKTGRSKEECEAIIKNSTWLTADKAKSLGIVDEIVPIFRDVQIENYFPVEIVNHIREIQDMPLKELCDQFKVKDEAELVALITNLQQNQPKKPVEYSDSIVNTMKMSRTTILDNLVSTGKAIPAVTNDLKVQYVNDDRIKIDLSTNNREFEQIVNSIAKNEEVISFRGKSGIQKPGENQDDDENILVRDMQRRVEMSKK